MVILTLILSGCGGSSETEPTPSAEARPTTPEAEPAAPALDLGPPVTLADADQAAIRQLLADPNQLYRTNTSLYGAPTPYLNDTTEHRARANQLLWVARHSEEPVEIVGALRTLGAFATYGEPLVPFPTDRRQLVLGYLSHSDPHIVAGVADAAGQYLLRGDEAIQTRLLALCRTHEHVVVRATSCAAAIQRPRFLGDAPDTITAALAALEDREPLVQIAVLNQMRYNAGLAQLPADTLAKVEPLLDSPVPAVRGLAALFVVRHAGRRSPTELPRIAGRAQALLTDGSPYVRMAAAQALLDLDPPHRYQHVDAVLPLLQQSDVASAPYAFRSLSFAGSALFGLVPEAADREVTYPASEAASWGNTVQALTLYYLFNVGEGVAAPHQLTGRPQGGSENFEAARTVFTTWWQAQGAAVRTAS
jgi:hypothetical protein